MNTKEFIVTVKVQAQVNTNTEFPENAYAIDIVGMMINDARSQCIRLSGLAERDGNSELMAYIEGKIKAYDAIEKTLA